MMFRHSLRALGRSSLGQHVASGSLRRSATTTADGVEVCFVDPIFLIEPTRLAAASESASSIQPYICLMLPAKVAQELGRGRFQLGDRDDPESHYFFGKEGELFQYKYVGSHAVHSGFASAVAADALRSVEQGKVPAAEGAQQLPSWADFAKHVDSAGSSGPPAPFLFAGRVVDCASVGVYRIEVAGDVDGMMLSSEYETAGAD